MTVCSHCGRDVRQNEWGVWVHLTPTPKYNSLVFCVDGGFNLASPVFTDEQRNEAIAELLKIASSEEKP